METKTKKTLDKKIIIKIISFAVMVGIIIAVTIIILPWVNKIGTDAGQEELKNYIASKQVLGAFIFIGLQALQVLLPIVPPIQIVGGLLFGVFWGSLLSCIGIYLGMSVVYLLVRLVGYPIVEAFVKKEDLKKFSFLKNPDKVAFIFWILYFIPGMPKDTISFLAPLTEMRKKVYFLYVLPARFPLIILSAVFGSAVSNHSYVLAVVLCVIMIALAAVGILFRDKLIDRFQKHSKSYKPLPLEKKIKKAIILIRSSVALGIVSIVLLISNVVFMFTSYFDKCKVIFTSENNFSGKEQVIYFVAHYGVYLLSTLLVIGIVSAVIGKIDRKKLLSNETE